MLYKLIIADDERIIREGLIELVDWASLGFEMVRQFPDGREAIEYIASMPVDVVLTDIKMTFVSGIEVAKYVYENKPGVKVILISGYKEFELALDAIKYGVEDYILKPTDIDKLVQVVSAVKEKLDREREELNRAAAERNRIEESLHIIREQFFIDLLMGVIIDREYIKKRIHLMYPGLDIERCTCFTADINIVEYDNYIKNVWKYGRSEFFNFIKTFLFSWHDKIHYNVIYKVHDNIRVFGILLKNENPEDLSFGAIEHSLIALSNELRQLFGLEVDYQIKQVFGSIFEVIGDTKPIVPRETRNSLKDMVGKEDMNKIREQQKLFLSNITSGNLIAIKNLFHNLLRELKYIDIRILKNFIVEMFATIGNKLEDAGMDDLENIGGNFEYGMLFSMKDIDEIEEWGNNIFRRITEDMICSGKNRETDIIGRARRYIHDNFTGDLSLEDVSGYFYLSPFYFSRIFKQQTGENFIDYLVRVKIEKAIKLLEDTKYKTYEISDMVGYKSSRYFSKIFKMNTGYTPSEYRRKILNKKDGEDESEI